MPNSPADVGVLLARPRLEAALDGALTRRLTSLTGGAGIGKTTLIRQWLGRKPAVWHTVTSGDISLAMLARGVLDGLRLQVPDLSSDLFLAVQGGRGPDSGATVSDRADSLAAELCRELQGRLSKDLFLVFDDIHLLGEEGDAVSYVAALCRNAPPRLHLITASRQPLPFPTSRMRVQGEAATISSQEMAFTEEEVGLLVDAAGVSGPGAATAIFERTGGWPVAVVLAIRLGDVGGPRSAPGDGRSDTELFEYLAEEVIASESPGTLKALRVASVLPWLDTGLAERLGIGEEASPLFAPSSRGVYVTPAANTPHAVSVSPLLRDFLVSRYPLDDGERRVVLSLAAPWYEKHAALTEALGCLVALAAPTEISGFVERRGETLLSLGMARRLLDAIDVVPPGHRSETVLLCEAEARQVLGDWEGASKCYEAMTPGPGEIPARLAWRLGFLSHMRGDVTAALDVYNRGMRHGGDLANEATLLGWTASAHWLRGERDIAQELANEALAKAREADDSRSLATAHTVLAMVAALDGDRAANDIHYLRALEHAERARDVIQAIRIRSNRSSHFLEEGDYDNALAELDLAHRLADMTGFQLWRAMALSNRAQVLSNRGSLEEAAADLEQAREMFRRLGSALESYPLYQMGDVYYLRGETALARAAYEEAIRLCEEAHDLQGLVPALSGLARVVAPEDPHSASALAERAAEVPAVIGHVRALLAAGFASLAAGDRERALDRAKSAAEVARARHDLPGLAEALELEGAATEDEDRARVLLQQAGEIWGEIDVPIGLARTQIALARVSDPAVGARLAGAAAVRLRALGAKRLALEAEAVEHSLSEQGAPEVVIRTLGGFGVQVMGEQVAASAWQSRVAREILAMLAANRGRSLHREVLMERLWPEEEPSKSANRLSVALSTIRGVLDPERRHEADRYLTSDRESVALDLRHLEVDVVSFFDESREGRRLLREGDVDQGLAFLRSAEGRYLGEFLEDQPYADWAIGLREEARAEFMAMAATLAEAESEAGDHDGAARWNLRILEQDAYNEPAHLALVRSMVAAGRHGTARRLYGIYVSRMSELDVEPSAFPAR